MQLVGGRRVGLESVFFGGASKSNRSKLHHNPIIGVVTNNTTYGILQQNRLLGFFPSWHYTF